MRTSIGILTTATMAALLTACGGGGGGSSVANANAEGTWSGTDSSGSSFNLLVLENGDFYSLYGTNAAGNFLVQGFDKGTSSMSGNALNASITEYDRTGTFTGTVNATVVTNTSIKGSATSSTGNTTVTLSATPLSASYSSYNYNTAPVNSDVFGNWTGTILDGSTATISISTAGGITGSNGGCTFTGTATPRSSGKNVFDMNLTFGLSPCAYPGQKVSGIALDYVLSNGKRQLLAAMQDTTKARGYLFFAQR
jgi:hypothetical protein